MRQILFLAPSLAQADTIVQGLHALGVEDDDIHGVASDPAQLQAVGILPATEVEATELENDLDWGMVAGGSLGLAAGMSVIGGGPFGFIAGGGVVLISSLAGIGLGGWLGTLIGEQTPRGELDKYRHAIEQGQVCMIIELTDEVLPPAFSLIRENCPQALIEQSTHSFDRQLAA